MDFHLPLVTSDGELRWPGGSRRTNSGGAQSLSLSLPTPWLPSFSSGSRSLSISTGSAFVQAGQLSPISNGVGTEIPCSARSSTSHITSSSQSPSSAKADPLPSANRTRSWTIECSSSEADTSDHQPETQTHSIHDDQRDISRRAGWVQSSSYQSLAVPKAEPSDEDDIMSDLQQAPARRISETSSADSQVGQEQQQSKRPRGRPRKHPLAPTLPPTNKVTKGRSKTGCLTCRKRKKKCDEAKPRCMNCEKNAVVCEGYPEKQLWKSGKERAEEERMRSRNLPPITMQPLFPGLETVEDMIFWRHYNEHLSTVLTVEGEHRNAFKDIMVPIAVRHQGLMHSILSLASKHLDFDTPYGINLLKNNPTTSREALRERSIYHHEQARQKFYEDIESTNGKPSIDDKTLISARYGQMLCFLLEALAEGSPRGEHRLHLNAYRSLISTSPPEDPAFLSFISEFFQYHIYADELIHTALAGDNNWPPKRPPPVLDIHPPRLLGVADGMLECLSEITAIRNSIRANMLAEEDPVVDYEKLYRATQIDAKIREWVSDWPSGDNRNRVTAIYQQMLWIYLVRTVYPPSSSPPPSLPSSTTSSAMRYGSPSHSRPTSSVVNTPPQSASTSCASSPRLAASNPMHDDKEPTPARTYSQHPGGRTADSPPPTRHPVHHDPRITQAVDEALSLLEEFKPSDPCQTLLLLPCFLIGTAAFSTTQQRRIRGVIRNVRGYTGLRNADRVMEVLEEIWRLMEMGQWAAVWDWPGVARRLGLDFIPA